MLASQISAPSRILWAAIFSYPHQWSTRTTLKSLTVLRWRHWGQALLNWAVLQFCCVTGRRVCTSVRRLAAHTGRLGDGKHIRRPVTKHTTDFSKLSVWGKYSRSPAETSHLGFEVLRYLLVQLNNEPQHGILSKAGRESYHSCAGGA